LTNFHRLVTELGGDSHALVTAAHIPVRRRRPTSPTRSSSSTNSWPRIAKRSARGWPPTSTPTCAASNSSTCSTRRHHKPGHRTVPGVTLRVLHLFLGTTYRPLVVRPTSPNRSAGSARHPLPYATPGTPHLGHRRAHPARRRTERARTSELCGMAGRDEPAVDAFASGTGLQSKVAKPPRSAQSSVTSTWSCVQPMLTGGSIRSRGQAST